MPAPRPHASPASAYKGSMSRAPHGEQAQTNQDAAERQYGTGSVFEKRQRLVWPVARPQPAGHPQARPDPHPGRRDGLTRKMAEARLRKLMSEVRATPAYERMTVEEAGERLIQQLVTRGRKASTTVGIPELPPRPRRALLRREARSRRSRRTDVEEFIAGLPRQRSVDQEHAQLPRLPAQRLRLRAAQGLGRCEPVQGGREARGRRRGTRTSASSIRPSSTRCWPRRPVRAAAERLGRRASERRVKAPARRRADAVEGDRGRAGGRASRRRSTSTASTSTTRARTTR